MVKKKNKNEPPVTQAINEPVQNVQQIPNSGYPYSGYPNSGYPNSGFPGSGYIVNEKKKSLAVPIAIAAGVVVIVAVIAVLFLMRNNNQMGMAGFGGPPPGPPPGMNMLDYSSYSQYEVDVRNLVVDGENISLPQKMLNVNNYSYVSVQDFANVFGFNTVFDMQNSQTVVSKDDIKATISNGMQNIVIMKGVDKIDVMMESQPLMFSNNQTYIPLRSFALIFDLQSIDWDEKTQTINVVTNSIKAVNTSVAQSVPNVATMNPNQMPPGGAPPQGGGYGAPPQQGGGYGAPPQQ